MIMEFFESHVWKLGSSSFGAFVVPVKYPISPFPRINNLMDWDHLRKFSPFSLWVVMCSEGLSLVPWGETWYGGIDTYYEEYLKFSSFLILDIKSSNQQPHSSRKKIKIKKNKKNKKNSDAWNQKINVSLPVPKINVSLPVGNWLWYHESLEKKNHSSIYIFEV